MDLNEIMNEKGLGQRVLEDGGVGGHQVHPTPRLDITHV